MNFYEQSFLFCAFLGLLLGIFFFLRRYGDPVANRLLGVYLLFFAFNLTWNSFFWSKLLYTKEYIHFFGLNAIPWLCYGPLFYLYQKRIKTKKPLTIYGVLHFLPVLIYFFAKSPFFVLDADTKMTLLTNGDFRNYGFSTLHSAYFAMVQMMVYGILSLRFNSKSENTFPKAKTIWVNYLIAAFFGYLVCFVTYFIRIELGYYSLFTDYILCYFIVFFVGSVAYFGIVQPQVFDGVLTINKVIPFAKYERTGLTKSYSLELKSKLIRLMETEKPYLDSDIRLPDLAILLDVPRHHASQVINEHFNSNFFDFINRYRVKQAEELLRQKDNLTIQNVAYQSGFNNRASFYKAFKKINGVTPKEYRAINLAS